MKAEQLPLCIAEPTPEPPPTPEEVARWMSPAWWREQRRAAAKHLLMDEDPARPWGGRR